MGERLGQHFLTDKKILERIADSVSDGPLVEIGPGHGELTEFLLAKNPSRILTSIERDPHLAKLFLKRFPKSQYPNTTLIEGDARTELPSLLSRVGHAGAPAVVGNIPYYLSGFLFRILGELEHKPSEVILTIQKEVAERAAATPPHMTLLSASLQIWCKPSVLFDIPAEAFSPPPKVRSSVLKLVPHIPAPSGKSLEATFAVIRALFRQPRKKAMSNLLVGYPDKKTEISEFFRSFLILETARPQEFSVEHIILLSRLL